MDTLFILDRKDYSSEMPIIERYCVRALISQSGKLMFQKSACGEYKLPGGGIEHGETAIDTMRREVLEETGLNIIDSSVVEIGEVLEKRQDIFDPGKVYLNHTLFYQCDTAAEQTALSLTPEEKAKGYEPVWESIENVIIANKRIQKEYWRKRDTIFLEWYKEQRCI